VSSITRFLQRPIFTCVHDVRWIWLGGALSGLLMCMWWALSVSLYCLFYGSRGFSSLFRPFHFAFPFRLGSTSLAASFPAAQKKLDRAMKRTHLYFIKRSDCSSLPGRETPEPLFSSSGKTILKFPRICDDSFVDLKLLLIVCLISILFFSFIWFCS